MNLTQANDNNIAKHANIALKAVLNILDKWGCTAEQKFTILGLSRTTFYRIAKAPEKASLSQDQIERISYILNIHQALRMTFSNTENIYGYMSMANNNPFFNGKSPLSIITSGGFAALYEAYKRIDALRGGQW